MEAGAGRGLPPEDDLFPETDEFGRDDPDTRERERRRLERERRRQERGGRRKKSSGKRSGGGLGGILGRGSTGPTKERPAPEPTAVRPAAEPTVERPAPSEQPSAAESSTSEPRRRAPRLPSGRGTFRRRRIAALVGVVAGLLLLWLLVSFFQPPPFDPGDGEGTVAITVPEGATSDEVADLLSENEVVSNGGLFKWRLRLAGKSDSILPGRYVLARDMSYGTAIDRLTGSGDKLTVTIPEGQSRDQIAAAVTEVGIEGDYLAATKSFKGFNPAKYGAKSPKSLEGFLFPATYELDRGAGVEMLVGQQLDAFRQNAGGVNLSYAQSKNLTVYDVLIIASMIDREVQVEKERPLVAAVIYNRLNKGQPLGIDATTRYEYGNYEDQLTAEQLNTPSPYNTRLTPGLTPTPIGNPGLASIQAAAKPAKVNYLFYVVKPGTCGEHSFTANEAEFEKLANEYQAALEAEGGSPTEC